MSTQPTSAPARLRALLKQDGMIVAPGAYDCISARVIAQAGFPAVYMTGAGTAALAFIAVVTHAPQSTSTAAAAVRTLRRRRDLAGGLVAGGFGDVVMAASISTAGRRSAHDLPRLAHCGQRLLLGDAELVEPGPAHQAQVRAPVRGRVERRDLARDLDRMHGERVHAGRPDPHAARGGGDLEQVSGFDEQVGYGAVVHSESLEHFRRGRRQCHFPCMADAGMVMEPMRAEVSSTTMIRMKPVFCS